MAVYMQDRLLNVTISQTYSLTTDASEEETERSYANIQEHSYSTFQRKCSVCMYISMYDYSAQTESKNAAEMLADSM